MASGRAVVSSLIGREGLEVQHGVHLLAAEEPAELAEQVADLLEDGDLRKRLALQARDLVEKRYDWDNVIAEQEQRYRKWLSGLNEVGGTG
jgi:glycosyltransferase involved in cell wall biosynthesis